MTLWFAPEASFMQRIALNQILHIITYSYTFFNVCTNTFEFPLCIEMGFSTSEFNSCMHKNSLTTVFNRVRVSHVVFHLNTQVSS